MLPPVNNDEKKFHNIFLSRVLFFYQTYVCTGVIEHVLNCWRLWFIYKRPIPKNISTTNQKQILLHLEWWRKCPSAFCLEIMKNLGPCMDEKVHRICWRTHFFKFSFEIWIFCFCITNGLESSWKDQIYLVPNGPWSIFVIHVWNAEAGQCRIFKYDLAMIVGDEYKVDCTNVLKRDDDKQK